MTQMTNEYIRKLEIQKQQRMMMGGMVNDQQKKLSPEEIKKMKQDYFTMYFGFTSINWGSGKTLGVSWQKALEQMDAYVMSKAKTANHPVNEEFIKLHRQFRGEMAKFIMKNPYTEQKLKPDYRQDFLNYGTKRVKSGKSSLDGLYQQYMPKENSQTPTMVKFNFANKNVQQILQNFLAQQAQLQNYRQRAA